MRLKTKILTNDYSYLVKLSVCSIICVLRAIKKPIIIKLFLFRITESYHVLTNHLAVEIGNVVLVSIE